ncbi:hypothetical protein PMG11_01390 [Penicillium brasilianum]|uniref:F-box domain-containing protein n=1 Tax=Penicillium brasilianum TaxID=104259 RepID=A0A0F7TF38_PENBI|nr:hypothetical protein PMG11_01390 [Penicillium brasilianum]
MEAEKAKPSTECFCYICGGASTWQRIVKASIFQSEGDQLENVVDSLFEDRCDCPRGRFRVSDLSQDDECHDDTCESRKGYDQRLIRLQDTKVSLLLWVPEFLLTRRPNKCMVAAEKWLEKVRMLSHYGESTPDANAEDLQSDTLLTPIGRVHHDREDGPWKFHASLGCDFVKSQGYLVHDACLQVLKSVHEAVVGKARPLDMKYDWDFGNAFDGPSRPHHRLDKQYWNSVKNTEWTVVNPQRKFDIRRLVIAALETSKEGLSFNIKCDKGVSSGLNARVYSDALSAIPTEVRLLILEVLLTKSVLNVLLASSAFRELSMNLPQSFWRSRMLSDVPWCGGEALAEILRQEINAYPFDKLLRLIRETSAPGGGKPDDDDSLVDFVKDSMTLRNKRRIWINSEQIIRDIEARHTAVRPVNGIVSTQIRKLSSRCTVFVTRDLGEVPRAASTVYFVRDLLNRSHLNKIIAYFGADSRLVGVEFQLLDEISAQLFGNRSETTSQITLDSPTVILVQILRVDPGQEVVGIAGEFSDQTITTFSIIIADQYLRPIHSHGPLSINSSQHTQWIGRHPPLDWPRGKYHLEHRRNGAHNNFPPLRNPFPRVLESPAYFVNLFGRQLFQMQAHGDFANIEAYGRTIKGLVFNFIDGSTERVGEKSGSQELATSATHTTQFEVGQREEIVDMVLFAAYQAPLYGFRGKLCGIEVLRE